MSKAKLVLIFTLFALTMLFSQLFAQGAAHNVYGILLNNDGNPPVENCIVFEAYILARPGEVLTENSPGCDFTDSTWVVNVGNFTTPPADGEILQIDFTDTCLNQNLTIQGPLDLSIPQEFWGTSTLNLMQKFITVLTPNGAETLFVGVPYPITWNTIGPVANVQIEYSLNNGASWVNEVLSTVNDGFYNWTPAATSNQALVRITDTVDDTVFDISDGIFVITFPPDITPPGAVNDLNVCDSLETALRLCWNAVGDDGLVGTAFRYDIRFSLDSITVANWAAATLCTGEPIPGVAGTPQTFWVNGLNPATTYFFAMIVFDEEDNASALSNVARGKTLTPPAADTIPPDPVLDLAVNGVEQNRVNLIWHAVGDDGIIGTATTYDIRYSTDPINEGNWGAAVQAAGEPAPLLSGTEQTFWVAGLTHTTLYYFAMKVTDDEGNISAISNVVDTTTLSPPAPDVTPPDPVSDLAINAVEQFRVQLIWSAVGDDGLVGNASAYDIRYSTNPISDVNWDAATLCAGEPAPLPPGTIQTYWVEGLNHSTLYYFAMKVHDEVPNLSLLSNVVNTRTLSPPEMDTLSPARINFHLADVAEDAFRVWWYAPGDDGWEGTATYYDFRYSTSILDVVSWSSAIPITDEPIPAVAGTPQDYILSGLTPSTQYWFAGKAYDDEGQASPLSNVIRVTTTANDVTPPGTIWDLGFGEITPTSIELIWTAPGDDGWMGTATGYIIKYATYPINSETWTMATSVPAPPIPLPAFSTQTYTLEGLTSGQTYYFRIQTYDDVPNYSGLSNSPSTPTMGILQPLADITIAEDSPDFYYVNLDTIFFPTTMDYTVTSTSPFVTLTLHEGSWIRAHLTGEYSGISEIIVNASSGIYTFSDTAIIDVYPVNDPPVFSHPPLDTTLVESVPFYYDVDAYDVDSDTIYYELISFPHGMTINHYTGEIEWTPYGIEGTTFVEVGITDLDIVGYVTQIYIVFIYKHSHPAFAPVNLNAHEGFIGAIPVTWDRPPIMDEHPELELSHYTLYRSIAPDVGYAIIGDNLVYPGFHDNTAYPGMIYFYKARASYSYPEFQSAYSNIDMGALLGSNTLWSPYIFDQPTVLDGQFADPSWGVAAHGELADGVVIYAMNNSFNLYLGFVFDMELTEGSTLEFYFDDDFNRTWDPMIPSTEGYYIIPYAEGETSVDFRWVSNLGGLTRGEPVLTENVHAAWRSAGGLYYLEIFMGLNDPLSLFAYPGDTIGVGLKLSASASETLLIWPETADLYNPEYFGKFILGMPGGLPQIEVNPDYLTAVLEEGWEEELSTTIYNNGTGTLLYMIHESIDWLMVVSPTDYIFPGLNREVRFHLYTAELGVGTYTDTIFVLSNDPFNPQKEIIVQLEIIPVWPFHILKIFPPEHSAGEPGMLVNVPIFAGNLHDNSIYSLEFTVYSDPSILTPTGEIFQGDYLPADWGFTTIYHSANLISVRMEGEYPLPAAGSILKVRYMVNPDGFYGTSCILNVDNIVINDGARVPVPEGGQGLFSIGGQIALFWEVFMELLDTTWTPVDSASFGVYRTATDGWDPYIDNADLPPQPEDINGYFVPPVSPYRLSRDARSTEDTVITWCLVIDQHPGYLTWDSLSIWNTTLINGMDMATFSFLSVEPGDTIYIVYYKPPFFVWNVVLHAGWNMVSVPIDLPDWAPEDVFHNIITPAYYYDPLDEGYLPVETLEAGVGYWVLCLSDTSYQVLGDPVYAFTLNLPAGWNMIGSPAHHIKFVDLEDNPEGAILDNSLFSYYVDPPYRRYLQTNMLYPGLGYWIMVREDCLVRISPVY
ncbi:fibronectin type III domain-containing protein [bacterium]|nr:fibronectin type III domain-containing protein [bacterium]